MFLILPFFLPSIYKSCQNRVLHGFEERLGGFLALYLRARLSNLQSAFRKISIPLILRLYIESRPCSIIDPLLVLLDFPRLCRTFARHPHTISHNHQKARCVCLLVIFCDFYEPNGKLLAEFQRIYLPAHTPRF